MEIIKPLMEDCGNDPIKIREVLPDILAGIYKVQSKLQKIDPMLAADIDWAGAIEAQDNLAADPTAFAKFVKAEAGR